MSTDTFDQALNQLDFEQRKALYWRGQELIKDIGRIDPNNEYELDWLKTQHGLSASDIDAYFFALEYDRAVAADQQPRIGSPTANAQGRDAVEHTPDVPHQSSRPNVLSSAPPEKPMNPKEKQSALKLILGLTSIAYGCKPTIRSSLSREIAEDLRERGLRVDDDTVRKWLQAADAEFGDDLHEKGAY